MWIDTQRRQSILFGVRHAFYFWSGCPGGDLNAYLALRRPAYSQVSAQRVRHRFTDPGALA